MSSKRLPGLALLALGACGQPPEDVGLVEEAVMVCPKGATTPGIDVSHWDGTIDWAQVKGGGVKFAFMKASEGATFVDPMFSTNWAGSAAHGVVRGAYHFFRPAVDPILQADHFLSVAGAPQPGDLPPTLDLETDDGLTGTEVGARTLQFLQRIEQQTGRVPIIYTSTRFLNTIGNPTAGFDHYLLWVVDWQAAHPCPDTPGPWGDWRFWQYTDMGKVPGIGTTANPVAVDLNRWNGSLSDLLLFVNPSTSADGGSGDGDLGSGSAADLAGGSGVLDSGGSSLPDGSRGSDDAATGDDGPSLGGATVHAGCACAVARRSEPPRALAVLALLLGALLLYRRRVKPPAR